MKRIAILITVVACSRPAPPIPATEQAQSIATASCGADCTSSITCHNIISSCRFCSLGRCSSTLPADPKLDAGIIDAAPGGTTP